MPQPLPDRPVAVSSDTDEELVARLKRSEVTALDEILGRYWPAMLRYSVKLIGDRDAAEDVVQETFLRLWRERNGLRTFALRSYLYRIAHNLVLDELRKRQVRRRWFAAESAQQRVVSYELEERSERADLYNVVRAAIESLPARRREAFTLAYLHGHTYRQVAEVMGISPETVKKQITLALADLRLLVKPPLLREPSRRPYSERQPCASLSQQRNTHLYRQGRSLNMPDMDDELLLRAVQGRATESERQEIAVWRSSSLEAARRYRELEQLLSVVAEEDAAITPRRIPNAAELLGWRENGPAPSAVGDKRRRRLVWVAGSAGLAAASVLAVWAVIQRGGPPDPPPVPTEYVTGKAETSTLELADGTVVRLAPGSKLQVTQGTQSREVTLQGRAYFAVAKAQNKAPFTINTTAGKVVVLGTQFDLQAANRDLRLVVVEGRVALSTQTEKAQVGAGQVGQVIDGAVVPPVTVPEVRRMVAWVGNFVAFQSTPLVQVARELKRLYKVRVVIADSALASRTVKAWLADQSLEEALTLICMITDARWSMEDGVVTIQNR